jgi:hypothetical protein
MPKGTTLKETVETRNYGKKRFCMVKFTEALGKGKAIPLQALTGPEGSRRLRFPDFKTVST